ncbi:hypothetical protein [Staphylococcus sp. GDQ8D205P]|uniref:hypothetical protein n=1 Tax=Staphylococcus sp. GDQ8D205P TaxID=2804095 RepID=UPI001AEC66C5|nr:hypothetical protein [Staphylococcus sp. GDQ8D205P]
MYEHYKIKFENQGISYNKTDEKEKWYTDIVETSLAYNEKSNDVNKSEERAPKKYINKILNNGLLLVYN